MADALTAFAAGVDASAFGQWAQVSPVAYPFANVMHVLGVILLIGGIGLLDLRLVGAFRSLPLVPLSRAVTPLAMIGLVLMFLSGTVMFASDAPTLVASFAFRWKIMLVALAVANALAFRWLWQKRLVDWDEEVPAAARIMAGGSIIVWIIVAILGRLIAYL